MSCSIDGSKSKPVSNIAIRGNVRRLTSSLGYCKLGVDFEIKKRGLRGRNCTTGQVTTQLVGAKSICLGLNNINTRVLINQLNVTSKVVKSSFTTSLCDQIWSGENMVRTRKVCSKYTHTPRSLSTLFEGMLYLISMEMVISFWKVFFKQVKLLYTVRKVKTPYLYSKSFIQQLI